MIQRDLQGSFSRRRYVAYHVISWSVPVILAICLKATPADPVNARTWCWFDDGATKYYPFFLLSVPLIVLACINLVLYVVCLRYVYRLVSRLPPPAQSSPAMQDPLLDHESGVPGASDSTGTGRRPGIQWRFVGLFMYPLVYIIASLFPLLLHMNVGVSGGHSHGDVVILPNNGVTFAAAVFAPAQGFLNCFIYFSSYAPARSRVHQIMQCLRHCDASAMNPEAEEVEEEDSARAAEGAMKRMGAGVAMTDQSVGSYYRRQTPVSSARASGGSLNRDSSSLVDDLDAGKSSAEERNLLRELSVASSLLDEDGSRQGSGNEEEGQPVVTPPRIRTLPGGEADATGTRIEQAVFLDRNWSALGDPRSADRLSGYRNLRSPRDLS